MAGSKYHLQMTQSPNADGLARSIMYNNQMMNKSLQGVSERATSLGDYLEDQYTNKALGEIAKMNQLEGFDNRSAEFISGLQGVDMDRVSSALADRRGVLDTQEQSAYVRGRRGFNEEVDAQTLLGLKQDLKIGDSQLLTDSDNRGYARQDQRIQNEAASRATVQEQDRVAAVQRALQERAAKKPLEDATALNLLNEAQAPQVKKAWLNENTSSIDQAYQDGAFEGTAEEGPGRRAMNWLLKQKAEKGWSDEQYGHAEEYLNRIVTDTPGEAASRIAAAKVKAAEVKRQNTLIDNGIKNQVEGKNIDGTLKEYSPAWYADIEKRPNAIKKHFEQNHSLGQKNKKDPSGSQAEEINDFLNTLKTADTTPGGVDFNLNDVPDNIMSQITEMFDKNTSFFNGRSMVNDMDANDMLTYYYDIMEDHLTKKRMREKEAERKKLADKLKKADGVK